MVDRAGDMLLYVLLISICDFNFGIMGAGLFIRLTLNCIVVKVNFLVKVTCAKMLLL